ncbi:MAG: DUF3991 and TOPRIM domain-containing protein [Gluconacetobacter diazotrophicus]|nr:DUF3991 and TOPRIM domain-containing protein [Gluconacetobacter diazotrophicus]
MLPEPIPITAYATGRPPRPHPGGDLRPVVSASRAPAPPRDAPAARWTRRHALRPAGAVWDYLSRIRFLPDWVLHRAAALDGVRDGGHAAWFAHRDATGRICAAELRGPGIHLCAAGSNRTLFRFRPHPGPAVRRLVVCETAIDALSVAALDRGGGSGSLYVSTGGRPGAGTVSALREHLRAMAPLAEAALVIATDADRPGHDIAAILRELAGACTVPAIRRLPPGNAKDFNQALGRPGSRPVVAHGPPWPPTAPYTCPVM